MAITYTDNLHLAMQEDKSDNLDWDALTENWRKIDAAIGSVPISRAVNGVVRGNGASAFTAGIGNTVEV